MWLAGQGGPVLHSQKSRKEAQPHHGWATDGNREIKLPEVVELNVENGRLHRSQVEDEMLSLKLVLGLTVTGESGSRLGK